MTTVTVGPGYTQEGADADLGRRLAAETRFSDIAAAGGCLSDLVRAVGDLLGCLVYLVTPHERVVARYVPPRADETSIPRLDRLLSRTASGDQSRRTVRVAPTPGRGGRAHYLLSAVTADGETVAYLVVAVEGSETLVDATWIVDRAAVHLGVEYAAQRRLARVAWNARSNLGRQMVRSTLYDEDLRAAAEYLGVDLAAERVIVFVLERGRSSASTVDARRLGELVEKRLGTEVLPIRGSEGALLAVAAPADEDRGVLVTRVKRAVVQGLETMGDQHAIAGVSSVTQAGQLRRAYREAREVARCIDRYADGGTRAVCCDELGPARLFVANSDEHSVRLYVHDVLGPLLVGGAGMVELLKTLACFFQAGRSIRETAVLLQVHENTVRHRLTKVRELTGLDVASGSQDQLSVHTALLVLRLQGHHAVPAFDDAGLNRSG
jgi:sugar diacid utilization regulator